jgi:hypothetical protein
VDTHIWVERLRAVSTVALRMKMMVAGMMHPACWVLSPSHVCAPTWSILYIQASRCICPQGGSSPVSAPAPSPLPALLGPECMLTHLWSPLEEGRQHLDTEQHAVGAASNGALTGGLRRTTKGSV